MPDQPDDWDETVSSIPGELEDEAPASQAYLVVMRGNNVGESFVVSGPSMVIGRGSGADLRVNDEGVSRFHCKLHNEHGAVLVEDLRSRNGTYCNGEPIAGEVMRSLNEGDRLQIGTTFIFRFTYLETTDRSSKFFAADLQDPSTGAIGRRRFMEQLEAEVADALAARKPLSLVLAHIDRSEELVAQRGARALDDVAVRLAGYLRQLARADDAIARIGAGDFALLSKRASPADTFMFAERLRKQMHADANGAHAISIGVAAMHEVPVETAHDFMIAAGSALHRARSQGGNRTVLCTPDLVREPKNRVKV